MVLWAIGLDLPLSIELWNQSVFLSLNAGVQAPAFAIAVARALANWSISFVMVLLIYAWIQRGREVRFALIGATGTALIGLAMARGITMLWYHPRPFEIGLGRRLLTHATEASFPSDHATLMFSLAIPLMCRAESRRWGAAFLVLCIAVAWSRIYLGVHFPLDMVGALAVAIVASALMGMADPWLRRRVYPLAIRVYETVLRQLRLPRSVFPRDL